MIAAIDSPVFGGLDDPPPHTDDDAPPEIGGLFSLILLETTDGWRIVHDHTSQPDS